MRITLPSLLGATALILTAAAALAQPVPTLSGPAPVYLQQSETQELAFGGANLAEASAAVLTNAQGLTADLVKPDKSTPGEVKVKLAAGAKAALGTRELRFVTPLGVTPPVAVTVGQFPATRDAEPNNAAEQAQPLSFPTSVVGRVDVGGDVDTYRFAARRGERLVFDVHAARLGSPLDPVVLLFDAAGHEQPRATSFRGGTGGGDPTFVFDPPADGQYTLQVRDVQYRGGPDYAYRIDAGAIPFVESVVPAGAPRGGKVRVQARGHHLGGGPNRDAGSDRDAAEASDATEMTVDLTTAEPGPTELRFRTPAGLSNPVPFVVADAPPGAESGGVGVVGAAADTSADAGEFHPSAGGANPSRQAKSNPQTTPAAATAANANTTLATAAAVEVPGEASGVLAAPGDEHFYRFTLAAKQPVTVEAKARQAGSPVDALLTLRDAKGAVVEQSNGAGEAEARIARLLEPGDYVVSVRDLTFAGGPGYAYRLTFAAGAGQPADFAVRFLPDAPRLARGSNVKLWCEVVRLNGYKGDVAVAVDGLPPGVTVTGGVATIGEQTSGVFTLSASADAALGTVPIKLRAVGSAGGRQTVRFGEAEAGGRPVHGAYLTVLDKPPFTVEAAALVRPEQVAAYPAEVQALYAKLNAPSPAIDKAQAAWEAAVGVPIEWKPLAVSAATAAAGTVLKPLPDGSVLAEAGKSPDRDTYTVVGAASLKQIAALRLEVLTDPSLPAAGPGRNVVGNFVLNQLTVTVAPKSDPTKTQPVAFASAKASFEQEGYPVGGATDDKPETGWALFGGTGKPQTAWFFPAKPLPAGDVVLTATLDQQFGQQHTIGRFRLSVTDDPEAVKRPGESVPAAVAAGLKTPPDKRTPEQAAQLSTYYRSVAPELKADRARLDALRNTVGPPAEVARLEAALSAANPAIDAERREWEQTVAAGLGWTLIDVTSVRSTSGTVLTREPDGSVSAAGPAPATETYTVTGKTQLRAVTAVRLEALPDERFPGGGPGRSGGNFLLTRFAVATVALPADGGIPMDPAKPAKPARPAKAAAPAKEPTPAEPTKPAESTPVPLRDARATFEQANYPVAGTLDNQPETGWAISPLAGVAHAATFFPRAPIVAGDGGTTLAFTLEFNSPKYQGFTLGRFRLWALGAADPAAAAAVPAEVQDVLKVAEEKRSDAQRAELAAYYRTISPALEPTRQRLAELRRKLPASPVVVTRGKTGTIPVPIVRAADFAAAAGGDRPADPNGPTGFVAPVQVTLEGFTAGRDPLTRQPQPIAKSIDVSPLTVDADAGFAKLTIRPKANSELGTRMVVLRAEAKVGGATYVQYSPAFPITVVEK
jgi:hypothetical protein